MTGTERVTASEPDAPEYLQPVLAGQHHVEDDELRHALFNGGEELFAGFQSLGLKAGGAQGVDLDVADGRVVLYAVYHVLYSPYSSAGRAVHARRDINSVRHTHQGCA